MGLSPRPEALQDLGRRDRGYRERRWLLEWVEALQLAAAHPPTKAAVPLGDADRVAVVPLLEPHGWP